MTKHNGRVSFLTIAPNIEYEIRREKLLLGNSKEILDKVKPSHLRKEPYWSSFRQRLKEIYSVKTGAAVTHEQIVKKERAAIGKVSGLRNVDSHCTTL
jgi:predicted metal-dependent hydrolase